MEQEKEGMEKEEKREVEAVLLTTKVVEEEKEKEILEKVEEKEKESASSGRRAAPKENAKDMEQAHVTTVADQITLKHNADRLKEKSWMVLISGMYHKKSRAMRHQLQPHQAPVQQAVSQAPMIAGSLHDKARAT